VGVENAGEVRKVVPIVDLKRPVELRKQTPRANDLNDAVVVSFIAGLNSIESRVHLGLIGALMANVAFKELRTSQQLGYVVNAGIVELSNVLLLSTVVQGSKLDADHMEAAVQAMYTKTMVDVLEALTEDEVKAMKASYKAKLAEPPTKIDVELKHFWDITAATGGECYGLLDEIVAHLETVAKDDLLKAYREVILPETGERRKIVVKYFAKAPPARLSAEETEALYTKSGVAAELLPMLRREYDQTLQLDAADSKARAEILEREQGAYFPPTLQCKRQPTLLQAAAEASYPSLLQGHLRQQGLSRGRRGVHRNGQDKIGTLEVDQG